MFIRPTTMGAALVAAAEKKFNSAQKVDHHTAHRVAVNANKTGFALVREFDKRPERRVEDRRQTPRPESQDRREMQVHPRVTNNTDAMDKPASKLRVVKRSEVVQAVMPEADVTAAIHEGITTVLVNLEMGRKALLADDEIVADLLAA